MFTAPVGNSESLRPSDYLDLNFYVSPKESNEKIMKNAFYLFYQKSSFYYPVVQVFGHSYVATFPLSAIAEFI